MHISCCIPSILILLTTALVCTSSNALSQQIQVAIVNDIAGHFEVLAGVTQVIRGLKTVPHIFYTGRVDAPDSLGLKPWLGAESKHQGPLPEWHALRLDNWRSLEMTAKVVICISAEMAPKVCQDLVDKLKPMILVLWVHRADTATATSKILGIHDSYKLVALAPHVATLAERRMKQPVSWNMPLAMYRAEEFSGTCKSLSCLKGFVVQGALRKYRNKVTGGFTRNYTHLWERMVEMKRAMLVTGGRSTASVLDTGGRSTASTASVLDTGGRSTASTASVLDTGGKSTASTASAAALSSMKTALGEQLAGNQAAAVAGSRVRGVEVCVLGKGGMREQLGIPAEVDADVEYLERLPYPEFWGRIYRSFALVPAFGMPVYYESRISSTIIASLITGVPLIAEQRLLDTYTFFTPEHVFLRKEGEDEVAAMYRIMGMPEEEIMFKRASILTLAHHLQTQSATFFQEIMQNL
ncbi:hypothetical protein CEUSTIGMA_g6507.t1 [Chlamydomonas eustigma]|uniref:Glycosyl transferase family 1 domain-containing protein n=1 Tax=Chlamydomonas eustigma TaxID=1157962 RepID=A0A250X7M5_9CHLO|nr:hypothetical protein CEUSTIGMA_g6507.t1 [Chlamydomonas eustigma]|eukprot:GAX79067.1 hypothetical protein CEUSTIGMA_g6507.t1 [Chlamydomonas eustigma]